MKEVFITPDGGDTLHRFNLNTTIDAVITSLESELEIESSESEHWTIAIGRSKIVTWNNFKDVKNLMLSKYLELYPISEVQKIDGAIPLYLTVTDSSYHLYVGSANGIESHYALSGINTLRAIVEQHSHRVEGLVYFKLQNEIIISSPILDIPLKELCTSRYIRIEPVFRVFV